MPVRQGARSSSCLTAEAVSRPPTPSSSSPSLPTPKPTPSKMMELLIDNSCNPYWPIRLRCGVVVMCRPEVFWWCPQVLPILNADLREILALLPANIHPLIQRTKIWVNHQYRYGHREQPTVVQHTAAHHHYDWLLWARDNPDKVMGIEIYNAADFCRMRQHWNGCGLLLHELCHIVHQVVLGLQNRRVIDLYKDAQRGGRYEKALRRDWAGKEVDHDMHYCMVDHKEFFAEMSVTFWSTGYRDLDQADTSQMEACCPPIMEPSVRKRFDGYKGRLFEPLNEKEGHCNKFQPFTAGQLREHDPELFLRMTALWRSIASWQDIETDSMMCCPKTTTCWPFRRPSPCSGDTAAKPAKSETTMLTPRKSLQNLLHSTLPMEEVVYAFGYGSGVFSQQIDGDETEDTTKMIDMIVVVRDAWKFHQANLAINPSHYWVPPGVSNAAAWFTWWQRYKPPSWLGRNPGVYFFLTDKVKYGVVQIDDLNADLSHWSYLYLAGRMHKPVLTLVDEENPGTLGVELASSITHCQESVNLPAALASAILLLSSSNEHEEDAITEKSVSSVEVYQQICGLSYLGDFRVQYGAEDPQKITRLVEGAGQLERFDSLYAKAAADLQKQGLLTIDDSSRSDSTGTSHPKWSWEVSPSAHQLLRQQLPFVASDLSAHLAGIVAPTARYQSFKGIVTAGPQKAWKYAVRKLSKGLLRR